MSTRFEAFIADLLEGCDVRIDGGRPWDVTVHDRRVFRAVAARGSLGLGEAYMEGWWDAEAVDQFLHRLLVADAPARLRLDPVLVLSLLKGLLLNPQRLRSREVAERHYDIGNDLYAKMLDPRMIYSCAYWQGADTLAAAQEAKLDLICRKLDLRQGQTLLDIGSGWGGLLRFAAERYGVRGVGVTVSRQQALYAESVRGGLPVETRLMDYMALDGEFDRIVSVGMFEHVGFKNYRPYLEKVRSLLKDDGLFLLHTIGGSLSRAHGDPWIEKYVFPNGMLPSPRQLATAAEGLWVMEDWHNFGADYDRTLMAWHANFEAAWPELRAAYGERFYRMWRYYLLACAASFRARWTHLWQIVYSPKGVPGGYVSPR